VNQQQDPNQQPFDKLKLMEAFETLEDPRRRLASCDHALQELLLTALCAISSGADDWVDVALWGREKLDWLRRFLAFENGIASHDTFSRVFALLDAKSFEACLIDWMEYLCPSLRGHAIHIDGKSLRGSHNGGEAMAHLVSAWDSAAGVTLGQVKTANKSNEITAIPQLLNLLDVRGATVTIDAMGCQREIVKQITEQGADYIIGVKNNQPTLAQAVESAFQDEAQGLQQGRLQQDIDITKDHGRLETRRCVVSRELSTLGQVLLAAWPGMRSLVMVHSQREFTSGARKGEVQTEWRYYISSCDIDAAQFNQQIRQHWSIENGCHWVLDVAFREDLSRVRVGHGAENFAILRRMTLNLINQNTTIKSSKKSKRKLAAWSTTRLQELLGLQELPAQTATALSA
jgi:predicted transposase YbfD/YdcC